MVAGKVASTYADDGPRLDRGVFVLDTIHEAEDPVLAGRRRVLLEESTELLLLVLVIGRVPVIAGSDWVRLVANRSPAIFVFAAGSKGGLPLDWAGLAVEQIRHKHPILGVLVAGGQDVGALDGLVEVAEDVVDDDNALAGIRGAGYVLTRWQLVVS